MKIALKIFIVLLALPILCGWAAAVDNGSGQWFPVGETIEYKIYWGIIPVGESTASTEWIEEDGRRLIAIRLRSKSNDFLSKFYPVDDLIESIVDPETFLPLRFTKSLNEGEYHCDETTHFDYENRTAHWKSKLNGDEKTYSIDSDTRDILSFMYYMRRQKLETDSVYKYRLAADEKVYGVTVKTLEEEKVDTKGYGKIKSLKVEPVASFDGLTVRKGRSWMWIARDSRRICTQVAVEVPVAKVRLKLVNVSGPGDDFWVEEEKSGYDPERNVFYK